VLESTEHGAGRVMLHGFRPHVDSAEAEVMPLWRARLAEPRRAGAWARAGREGLCPQHLSACWFSARMRIPAGQHWYHATGVEALFEVEG
jgi:hypothetical protein